MKTLFKGLVYISFLLFTIIMFLPKNNIYYFVEEKLSNNKIILSNEDIKSSLFDFEISKSLLIYQNTKFAKIEDIKIKSFVFYNSIDVSNIEVLDKYTNQYPIKTKSLNLSYSILNPLFVDIKSTGDFGKLSAKLDLLKNKITYRLTASNSMKKDYKKILRKMKLKKGEYIYEQQF